MRQRSGCLDGLFRDLSSYPLRLCIIKPTTPLAINTNVDGSGTVVRVAIRLSRLTLTNEGGPGPSGMMSPIPTPVGLELLILAPDLAFRNVAQR